MWDNPDYLLYTGVALIAVGLVLLAYGAFWAFRNPPPPTFDRDRFMKEIFDEEE